MKRNKGITLIALVITIIVLLILAGVAISMLSGENGILRKAAEAKTKTEEAQKEESTTLLDMEIDSYFITNNLKYKCRYGYITGIKVGEKAKELKDALSSQGYTLRNIENTADVADETKLTTGMAITKNGEIIARTVIFGDTNCDGDVELRDLNPMSDYFNGKLGNIEYKIAAMDINHDGYIDYNDEKEITKYNGSLKSAIDDQEHYASKLKKITRISTYDIIKKLEICNPDSIKEVKEDNDIYNTIELNKGYTYQELETQINQVYPKTSITFFDDQGNVIDSTSTDKVQKDVFLDMEFPAEIENDSIPEKLYIQIQFK